ncbi:hypothetical protein NDU88_002961 [Pleurodeles waltl]|uniref:Uncharacterized protein n=1 Tax=Pleurodeles waltl TaxID=8319 RepID=A0AAV7KTK0_PLEWA|nr:hypothetical protein NDU88_002961 [Pleurodeles waltl]
MPRPQCASSPQHIVSVALSVELQHLISKRIFFNGEPTPVTAEQFRSARAPRLPAAAHSSSASRQCDQ